MLAEYYRRALPDLGRFCDEQGARLVLVNLDLEKRRRGDMHAEARTRLRRLLESIASEAGLTLFDTGGLFAGCRACYLRFDGHLSAKGRGRLAGFLDAKLTPEP